MISSLLAKDAVPRATLQDRYGSLLELVETMIGVVPNCDNYLEIWPTAFRTYNVLVPNLFNAPFMIWGIGASPGDMVSLGMYVASRAAACPYCSAHSCSFGLRRGTKPDQIAAAMEDEARLPPPARAVARVARALGHQEAALADDDRAELLRQFKPDAAEWIVLGIAMMGWLNKTMNGLGVPLEPTTVAEVNDLIAPSGWAPGALVDTLPASTAAPRPDSLWTKLRIVRYAPSAISLDKKWTAGVPDKVPAATDFLKAQVGAEFPVLARLGHARAVKAIATAIRDNFDPSNTVAGLPNKLAVGLVYAETVGATSLATTLRSLGAGPLADPALAALAGGLATSPTTLDDAAVEKCGSLAPAAIVELVTFVSLLQLLHRLERFYGAATASRS